MGDGGIYIWSMWGDKEFVVSAMKNGVGVAT